jgi:1H-pyrrole-2-carbonyl-[peptidyl-carrier protein] brominase
MRSPVVIVGGGPGGACAAMFLAAEGVPSVIVEKEAFPRYHIGESMTGECGGVVRALGLEDRMLAAGHPRKQGVKVFGPTGHSWFVPVMARERGELVDAYTWQVRRSEFDRMLLDEARARGAEVVRGEALAPRQDADGRVTGVRVRLASGREVDIASEMLLDASGQRTFLARRGLLERQLGRYDRQVAVFSQVAGARRDPGGRREDDPGNTLIFYKGRFHWAWFIPLDDDVVSVGVVAPGGYLAASGESKADYLRRELLELHPDLARRVGRPVTLVEEARAVPNYSYHCRNFAGPGWLCLGDAHRFIDPIFSFGLFVSMKEAQVAAPLVAAWLGGTAPDPWAAHVAGLEAGLNRLQDLIDGFWERPLGFAHLVHRTTHRPGMIDLFAGRIYGRETSPALEQLRLLARAGRGDAAGAGGYM